MAAHDDVRVRQLEEEVGRLHALLAGAPNFILQIGLDRCLEYTNRVVDGYTLADVIGASIDGFIPENYRARVHAAIDEALRTGEVQTVQTMGATSADTVGHYLSRVRPIFVDGHVRSFVLATTDVTELLENRTRLQLALDATEMGIWTFDASLGRGDWDDRTKQIFGVPPSEGAPSLQDMLAARLHPDDASRVEAALGAALTTGVYEAIEHRVVHPDGAVRWVAASGVAVPGADGQVSRIVGGVYDITERRAIQERLHQSEKLQSIGRLAGGIAHDFNNMLTTILGNIELAQDLVEDGTPLAAHLHEVQLAAERSAALTAQLLAFARKQVIEPRRVDPNALVVRLDSLLRRVLGEQIEVRLGLDAEGGIDVDPSQLEQVLLNLVTNARDAMPQGGCLSLRTSDVSLSAEDIQSTPEALPGDYVQITVSDTGGGIPAEVLPHVFEPFFSTRESGTGLGLATCHGIVAQNGGHIEVSSSASGTSFLVRLPRKPKPAAVPKARSSALGSGRGESILVVEDEPMVRSILVRALRGGGFRVEVADSPEAALLLAESQGPFQLLVTDVVMPGMDGRALASRLCERWPDLKVLLISGYAAGTFRPEGVLGPGLQFLQKPFLPGQLLAAVRKTLDGSPS